jgi:hypothetical protein
MLKGVQSIPTLSAGSYEVENMSRTVAISLAFRGRQWGTSSKQAGETYVGDVVAALDRAGVALIGVGATADMRVPFHARAGGDGDGDGEQGRDASEHGRREEEGLRLENIWASGEAYLCCRRLGLERK